MKYTAQLICGRCEALMEPIKNLEKREQPGRFLTCSECGSSRFFVQCEPSPSPISLIPTDTALPAKQRKHAHELETCRLSPTSPPRGKAWFRF